VAEYLRRIASRSDKESVMKSGAVFLVLAGVLLAQSGPSADLADADKAIQGLRQISKELSEAVKRFHQHLDEAIALHDRWHRLADDRQIRGADVDLTGAPADLISETVRKFTAFRMLAARSGNYEPAPVADMDQIRNLILESRERVEASTAVLRRLLVVSVKDLDPHRDANIRIRHDQLLKARGGAEEAARQALAALPVELPDSNPADEGAQKDWDLLAMGRPGVQGRTDSSLSKPVQTALKTPELPTHYARRKRFTLVSDSFFRMAITDSGIEDASGRRLFYEEEWILRGASVIRLRWRVAVDTATEDHVLLKRYPPLEMHGSIEELYRSMDRYSVWYMEPPDEGMRPAPAEVEAALAEVEDARTAILTAADDFRKISRESLTPVLDAGLAPSLRETLFSVRAHLAGEPRALAAEEKVRRAIAEGWRSVASLEAVASWANRLPEDESFPVSSGWDSLLDRSEREIDLLRSAAAEAVAFLPPGGSGTASKFPALQKDLIVRMRRPPGSKSRQDAVLQEIWRSESPMQGAHEVRRTATLIVIDRRSGTQTAVASKTKYYATAAGDMLEEVFDEYAADDILDLRQ
jgi:hypothetical protein